MENKKNVTIIGFGNQAKAWSMNLRDSGFEVTIGLRPNSPSIELAKSQGYGVFDYTSKEITSKLCVILTPDDSHLSVMKSLNGPNSLFVFAHGFSVVAQNIKKEMPEMRLALLAPKAIASELRFRFETNQSLAAFYSLEHCEPQDKQILENLAGGIGIKNFYSSSFLEETQADLFSEQALLCSILPYAINQTYQTLIDRGFKKELAFYECFVEAKLIIDTLLKVGPEKFFDFISPNALAGSEIGRKLILDSDFERKLDQLMDQVQKPEHLEKLASENIDFIRETVNDFWKRQSLNQTFNDLKGTI